MTLSEDDSILQAETFELTCSFNNTVADYLKYSTFAKAKDVVICSLLNAMVEAIYKFGYKQHDVIELAERIAQAIVRNTTLQDIMSEEKEDYDF